MLRGLQLMMVALFIGTLLLIGSMLERKPAQQPLNTNGSLIVQTPTVIRPSQYHLNHQLQKEINLQSFEAHWNALARAEEPLLSLPRAQMNPADKTKPHVMIFNWRDGLEMHVTMERRISNRDGKFKRIELIGKGKPQEARYRYLTAVFFLTRIMMPEWSISESNVFIHRLGIHSDGSATDNSKRLTLGEQWHGLFMIEGTGERFRLELVGE